MPPQVSDYIGLSVKSIKSTQDGWQINLIPGNYNLYVIDDPTKYNLVGKILTNVVFGDSKSTVCFNTQYTQGGYTMLKDEVEITQPLGTFKIQSPGNQVQPSNRPNKIPSGGEINPEDVPTGM